MRVEIETYMIVHAGPETHGARTIDIPPKDILSIRKSIFRPYQIDLP